MAAGADRGDPARGHRTRLTGRLPLVPKSHCHSHRRRIISRAMQDRLNRNDVTNRVNVEDPQRVRDAVVTLLAARFPGSDFTALARAFDDLQALFEGRFPGYLACDTLYHDVRHTLDMTLAMARLIDGPERVRASSERPGPAGRARARVSAAVERKRRRERPPLHQSPRDSQRRVRGRLFAADRLRRRGRARRT